MLPDLLPGATLDEGLEVSLRDAATSAANLRAWNGTGIASRIEDYSRFCVERATQLGRTLRPSSVSRLLLTHEYYAIVALTHMSLAAPHLIEFEVERCQRRLDEAHAAVATERRRWAQTRLLIVADTNVLLHSIPGLLADYDWRTSVGGRVLEPVTVALLSQVIDELDRKKRDGKKETVTRARVVLRELDDLFEQGTTVELVAESAEAAPVRLTAVLDSLDHVRLASADSEILDSALSLQARVADLVVLTGDTGMALRARHLGLRVVKIATPRP